MGTFRYHIELLSPVGQTAEALDALVDTGATYTWVPRPVLERLGIAPAFRRQFLLADGTAIWREMAEVLVRLDGQSLYTLCIFGDEGSEPLLGVYTLEGFGLGVDPVNRRLVPVPGYLTKATRLPAPIRRPLDVRSWLTSSMGMIGRAESKTGRTGLMICKPSTASPAPVDSELDAPVLGQYIQYCYRI